MSLEESVDYSVWSDRDFSSSCSQGADSEGGENLTYPCPIGVVDNLQKMNIRQEVVTIGANAPDDCPTVVVDDLQKVNIRQDVVTNGTNAPEDYSSDVVDDLQILDIGHSAVIIGANAPEEVLLQPATPLAKSIKRSFDANPESQVGRSRKVSINDALMGPKLRVLTEEESPGGMGSYRRNTWSGLLRGESGRKIAKGRRVGRKQTSKQVKSDMDLIRQPLITRLFKPSDENPVVGSSSKCKGSEEEHFIDGPNCCGQKV